MASTKKDDIVQMISEMKMVEFVELVDAIKEKFGVTDAMLVPAASAAPQAGQAEGAAVEEKTAWNVMLTSFGEKKINVIKVVRDVTKLSLKDAKNLVEASGNKPSLVKEDLPKEDAEKLKKQLEDAGATVDLV